jgi:hypothetical protein
LLTLFFESPEASFSAMKSWIAAKLILSSRIEPNAGLRCTRRIVSLVAISLGLFFVAASLRNWSAHSAYLGTSFRSGGRTGSPRSTLSM